MSLVSDIDTYIYPYAKKNVISQIKDTASRQLHHIGGIMRRIPENYGDSLIHFGQFRAVGYSRKGKRPSSFFVIGQTGGNFK